MTRQTMIRRIRREFMAGLSCIGLARKYGLTNVQVQDIIRRWKPRRKR